MQLQACTVSSKMRLIYANLGVQSKAALIRLAFPHVEHELAMAEAGTTSAPS